MPQNLGNRELQFWALGRSGFLGRTDAGDRGGNKGYCVSLKLEAEKAKLPGVSNSKMYRDFQKAGFDMWGSLGTIMRGRFEPEADVANTSLY